VVIFVIVNITFRSIIVG